MIARSCLGLTAGALTLAACALLGPQPDRSRFFVLTPVAGATGAAAPLHFALGLGPLTLPPYLARSQVATRVAPNQVAYSDRDRWAEPLATSFASVLERDLAALLGSDIVHYPWLPGTRLDYAVAVEVTRFEPDPAGTVRLVARMTVRAGGGDVLATRDVQLTETAGGEGTTAAVAALSRAVADLGREIATEVRGLAGR